MAANKKTKIIILGGGFGGLYTALHLEKTLARDPQVEITLVNKENFIRIRSRAISNPAGAAAMSHVHDEPNWASNGSTIPMPLRSAMMEMAG